MDDAERGFRQSLWAATVGENAHTPQLSGSHETDVVIIGAGITGLSAALHLAEKDKSVIVLEAREIAWGAAGRNGGQVNPGWKMLPSQIRTLYGPKRGDRVISMVDGACDLVFELIDRHNISCAPRRAPYFRAAFGRRGLKEVRDWVAEWGSFGAPVVLKNQQQTHDLIGSSFYSGGMEDARGGSLQPLSYTRGLARAALQAGAEVFSQSRVRQIDRVAGNWRVTTDNGGQTIARFLIIGTNGYTDELWSGLQKQVIPVASLQAATEPLPAEILHTMLPQGHHFSDTRRDMVYCRIDENRRFQIGGRGSPFDPVRQQAATKHLQAQAVKIFPQLNGINWEYEWGGLVAMTKSHAPQLIELGEKAYAGLGYNGRGIAMATMMGKQMAELVMGEDVAMPCEKLSPIAFHGLRNLGIAWHMMVGRTLDKFM